MPVYSNLVLGEIYYAVEKLPSFYDYIAYMYYCGGTIAGPFYEYKDYIDFIQRINHYADIPGTFLAAMIRLSHAISKFPSLIFPIHSSSSTKYSLL